MRYEIKAPWSRAIAVFFSPEKGFTGFVVQNRECISLQLLILDLLLWHVLDLVSFGFHLNEVCVLVLLMFRLRIRDRVFGVTSPTCHADTIGDPLLRLESLRGYKSSMSCRHGWGASAAIRDGLWGYKSSMSCRHGWGASAAICRYNIG